MQASIRYLPLRYHRKTWPSQLVTRMFMPFLFHLSIVICLSDLLALSSLQNMFLIPYPKETLSSKGHELVIVEPSVVGLNGGEGI
jgi:hypothetical protein